MPRTRIMTAMSQPSHSSDPQAALRALPAVDQLLRQPAVEALSADYPRGELVQVVRAVLDDRRAALRAHQAVQVDIPSLALDIRQRLYERSRPQLRRVINATGIVLHTNLGRAPLSTEAIDAIVETAGGYCNLELDLQTGRRGLRHDHVRGLLREICGVEDAFVVNNNAAATYLTLNTLAAGREVIVSRGQLVEIGGSYRLPDIMAAAQCRMVEVGTTNRTRVGDYERAINDETAVLLRVHCSNYRVEGFTESTPLEALVELAQRHHLLVVDDLGSGLVSEALPWPEANDSGAEEAGEETEEEEAWRTAPDTWDEPAILDSVDSGAHLTLFSGDKLLGGPQAGIAVGRADLVSALRRNPLARTFRPGKLTLAALEATLRLYRDPSAVVERIPTYRMLARTPAALEAAAHRLAEAIAAVVPEVEITGRSDVSEAGGGSLPTVPFPTCVVEVRVADCPAAALSTELRRRELPVICRIRDDALVFDPRTLTDEDAEQIPGALVEAVRALAASERG
jgi:L-seryl-tRNA(Ser) seleniumtransferase